MTRVIGRRGGEVYPSGAGGGGGGAAGVLSAGTSSISLGQAVFSNSNGISFGLSGSTVTASVAGAGAAGSISAGTTSVILGQAVFSNSNNVSFGLNVSTVTASVNPGLSAVSGGTTNVVSGGVNFSNSNGVSFGLNASTMTASVNPGLSALSAGTTNVVAGGVNFSNSNGVSFGLSGSTVTASVAGAGAAGSISAGTTSVALGQVVLSNSNGVSFGMNGSTVTASVAGVSAQSIDFYDNLEFAFYGVNSGAAATGNAFVQVPIGTAHGVIYAEKLHAEKVFPANITASTGQFDISFGGANLSAAFSSTLMFGVYTSTGQTLSLLNSFSSTFGATANAANSNSWGGERFLTVHSSQWSSSPVFAAGSQYYMASVWLTAGSTANTNGVFGAAKQPFGFTRSGTLGAVSVAGGTIGFSPFFGQYSATSVSLPASIANSELSKSAVNNALGFVPHFQMIANTVLSAF